MNEKTSDNVEMTDTFTETIQGFVELLQERAVGVDKIVADHSATIVSETVAAKIEPLVNKFQSYVEKNPMMATMMAFGMGAFSTQVLQGRGMTVAKEAPSDEPQEASVSKAA